MCVCEAGYSGERCDVCADGYQDNDGDGSCKPSCSQAGLVCSDGRTCDDKSGEAKCVCDADLGACAGGCADGHQDNDGDGTCEPTCATAALACHNGACDDASGTPRCECEQGYAGATCDTCADGYQDNDGDGTCAPDCTSLACGHGACNDSSGTAQCVCDVGYTGATCDSCDDGHQDNDANGTCTPTCATADLACGSHGACSDASGTARCDCDPGYDGELCETCAAGFQDNDQDGTCAPDCTTAGLSCGHGACNDSGGTAQCVCDIGYTGAACDSCDAGYQDNDANGTCAPDCMTAGLACGHGACSDLSGTAQCVCDIGYISLIGACDSCDTGYQDNDLDGTCVPDCTTANLACAYGECSDTTGTALCLCDLGYTGAACDSCDAGYQDNDANGTCSPTCATAGLACGSHGTCSDTSGTARCDCELGYAGALCDTCASGYQDNDGDGTCVPDCTTANLACGHGACSDTTGTALCLCDLGYTGAACDSCDAGYQDNDANGTCSPTCAAENLACVHGTCSDTSGTARCDCELGYAGALCETCATGFQDNDTDGTCTPDCTTAGLSCGHGACSDLSGTVQCVCELGYTGAACESCDSGYQDNDANGTCAPTCATADLACNTGYACDDTSGTAKCEVVPPGPVSNLRYGDLGGIELHWTPPEGHWDTVVVVRKTNGYPSSPDDGDVIFEGRARSTFDGTAEPGTTYHYAVWAMFDGVPSTSAAQLAVTGHWTAHAYTQSADLEVDSLLRYLTVHAWGAGGGGGFGSNAGAGGGGGYATATLQTTPGEQYRIVVGGQGRSGQPGGYNGTDNVGRGAYGNCSDSYNNAVASTRGGSGGQMSGLYEIVGSGIPVDIARWVVIAGGGGGGVARWNFAGGGGGGASGTNGNGPGGGRGGGGGNGGAPGGNGGPPSGGTYGSSNAGSSWTNGGHGGASIAVPSATGGYAGCGGAGGGGYGGGGGGAPGYDYAGGGGGGGGYARAEDGVLNMTLAASGRNAAQSTHHFYPASMPGRGGARNGHGNPGYVLVLQGRCPPGFGGPTCNTDILAPEPVTNLTVVDGELTWTPSTSADAVGVVIRRSASAYPSTVDDGEFVADLPADVDRYDVPAGFYALFSYDAAGNYSQRAQIRVQ